jgi:hypothetical protein
MEVFYVNNSSPWYWTFDLSKYEINLEGKPLKIFFKPTQKEQHDFENNKNMRALYETLNAADTSLDRDKLYTYATIMKWILANNYVSKTKLIKTMRQVYNRLKGLKDLKGVVGSSNNVTIWKSVYNLLYVVYDIAVLPSEVDPKYHQRVRLLREYDDHSKCLLHFIQDHGANSRQCLNNFNESKSRWDKLNTTNANVQSSVYGVKPPPSGILDEEEDAPYYEQLWTQGLKFQEEKPLAFDAIVGTLLGFMGVGAFKFKQKLNQWADEKKLKKEEDKERLERIKKLRKLKRLRKLRKLQRLKKLKELQRLKNSKEMKGTTTTTKKPKSRSRSKPKSRSKSTSKGRPKSKGPKK